MTQYFDWVSFVLVVPNQSTGEAVKQTLLFVAQNQRHANEMQYCVMLYCLLFVLAVYSSISMTVAGHEILSREWSNFKRRDKKPVLCVLQAQRDAFLEL